MVAPLGSGRLAITKALRSQNDKLRHEAAGVIEALYEALVELLDLNDAADTCMGGLADCRDGGNGPVQSRELETVLAGAGRALAKARGEHNG